MSGPTLVSGGFYRPAEVAQMLRCSVWWVKEQARRRNIPYAWIGGSYLFTAEHIAEIVRRFEVQPTDDGPAIPTPRRSPEQPSGVEAGQSTARLIARQPRRKRAAA